MKSDYSKNWKQPTIFTLEHSNKSEQQNSLSPLSQSISRMEPSNPLFISVLSGTKTDLRHLVEIKGVEATRQQDFLIPFSAGTFCGGRGCGSDWKFWPTKTEIVIEDGEENQNPYNIELFWKGCMSNRATESNGCKISVILALNVGD